LTITNGSNADFQAIVVDASTNDTTTVDGVIDLNVDTSTNSAIGGLSLTLGDISDGGNDTITGNSTILTIQSDAGGVDTGYASSSTGIGGSNDVSGFGSLTAYAGSVAQTDDGDGADVSYGIDLNLINNSGDAGDILYGIRVLNSNTASNQITDAFIFLDNQETTAATIPNGILITSSGVAAGITDAIDVSASNILNAINIGDNPIVTGNVAGTIGDATTDS